MGQFSWKTSDTKRAITIWDCEDGSFPVYLVTPDNEKILERNYEGYGVFGGYDAMNYLLNGIVLIYAMMIQNIIDISASIQMNVGNGTSYMVKIIL